MRIETAGVHCDIFTVKLQQRALEKECIQRASKNINHSPSPLILYAKQHLKLQIH